jgi:hypothetical protein
MQQEGFWLSLGGLVLLLLTVFVVWLTYGIAAYTMPETLEKSGQTGDMFGGITALFSGLAFAGLVFTLFVQKKELQYQREELGHLVEEQRQTKGHLKDQATHLKSQSDFIERQIFENSFFQLLSTYSQFVSQISTKEHSGADALEVICGRVRPTSHFMGEKPEQGSILVIDFYEDSFEYHKNDLAPYFRLIYNLLKFLDQSNIQNKAFYSNLLRAMLNSSELTLLSLNCASAHGVEKMAPLVKKFNFLKHFDDFSLFGDQAYDHSMMEFYHDWDYIKLAFEEGRLPFDPLV